MVAHIFISGFVQGVGFRQFVKKSAVKLGLKGWVKNLPDNRVEGIFVGEKEIIEKMILICKKGPFLSGVENVDIVWEDLEENLTGFEIRK